MTAEQRKAIAEQIAKAEGFAIAGHDADWMTFGLADDLVTDQGTMHTFFSWESFKFEGAVTMQPSSMWAQA